MADIRITSPDAGAVFNIGDTITVTVNGGPLAECRVEPAGDALIIDGGTAAVGPFATAGTYKIIVAASTGKDDAVIVQVLADPRATGR